MRNGGRLVLRICGLVWLQIGIGVAASAEAEKAITDPADLPAGFEILENVGPDQILTTGSSVSIGIPADLLPGQMRFNIISYKSAGGAADSIQGGSWSPSKATVLTDRVDGGTRASLDLIRVTLGKKQNGLVPLTVTTRGAIVEPGGSILLNINPTDANPSKLYLNQAPTATREAPDWYAWFWRGALTWPAPGGIHDIVGASVTQIDASNLELSVVTGTSVPARLPPGVARPFFQFNFLHSRGVQLIHNGRGWQAALVRFVDYPGSFKHEVLKALPVRIAGNTLKVTVLSLDVTEPIGIWWIAESRPQVGPAGAGFWKMTGGWDAGRIDIAPNNGGFISQY